MLEAAKDVSINRVPDDLKTEPEEEEGEIKTRLIKKTVEKEPEENSPERIPGVKGGLWAIIGVFVMQFFMGHVFMWKSLGKYQASYMHSLDDKITMEDFSYMTMVTIISMLAVNPIAAVIYRLSGPKPTIFLGGLSAVSGVFLSSYCGKPINFYVLYGVCFGVGVGTCYMPTLMAAHEFYRKYTSLLTFLATAFFTAGTFIGSLFAETLINPHNVRTLKNNFYPTNVADNTPLALRFFGFMIACYVVIGMLTIKRNKIQHNKEKSAWYRVPTIWSALFTIKFFHLFIMLTLGSYFGIFVTQNFRNFGLNNQIDDFHLMLSDKYSPVISIGFLLVFGLLYHLVGFKWSYILSQLLQGAAIAGGYYAPVNQDSPVWFVLFVWLAIATLAI